MFVTSQGLLYGLGNNRKGCIDPSIGESKIFTQPHRTKVILASEGSESRVVLVAAGKARTLVTTSEDSVIAWGSNQNGARGFKGKDHQIGKPK